MSNSTGFMIGGIAAFVTLVLMTIMLFETNNETTQTFYWVGIVVSAMVLLMCYVGHNKDGIVKRAICENYDRAEHEHVEEFVTKKRNLSQNRAKHIEAGNDNDFAPVSGAGNARF